MKTKTDLFSILHNSEDLIAINKPYGYFVHQSSLDPYSNKIVLQRLRDQIGRKVFPIHRLDRKTTGVLLFALNHKTQIEISKKFMAKDVQKKYLAMVRGWTEDTDIVDYPLTNLEGKTQEAMTKYTTLKRYEIPLSSGRYNTSRYSLLRLEPSTGRYHQLRKHLAHIRHPIIGDRPHGCNKQNKFFKTEFSYDQMMLHAEELSFCFSHNDYKLNAPPSEEFTRIWNCILKLNQRH